ncbi:MAG: DUF4238 domain-containing protein [Acidimicrobiia bacterium]|nr:DUF4238 domain-containing protein [Acidimicrobiia bacterium]
MNQHLVSKVLLKRFARPEDGKISGFDLPTREERTDSPRRFGAVEDLVTKDAEKLERKWNNQVETRLNHAFKIVDRNRPITEPKVVETIKRCIALHWARGVAVTKLLGDKFPEYAEKVADGVLEHYDASTLLQHLTGQQFVTLDQEGPAREVVARRFAKHLEEKGFIGSQFLHHYNKAKERVAPYSLELWHSPGDEFLIADIPVCNYNKKRNRVGVLQGVPWNESDLVFMSAGPRHVVALAQQPAVNEANDRLVEQLNVYQVRGAFREVYYRPGSGLGNTLSAALGSGRSGSTSAAG